VVTRDRDHRIARVNAAFRQLTGHDDKGALGRTADEMALWETAAQREAAEANLSTTGSLHQHEARLLTQGHNAIDCLVSAETVDMDQQTCVLWVYQDVTERRRNELELAGAINEVMKDASWLSRSILDKLATLRRPSPAAPAVDLSPREREVLGLICDDLDDGDIAERLNLSRNTVRNHVARIYAKLGVNRRSGAVVWGRERGLGSNRSQP
jgi:PAS domain S-box-containing protein